MFLHLILSLTIHKFYILICFVCVNVVTCNHHMFGKYFQELWMKLQKNQLFCLLDLNGSGKTTVVDCLIEITRHWGQW